MSYLIANSIIFNYSRISAEDSTPVVSQLSIGPVPRGLNGTEVNCIDVETTEGALTVIIIIECQCPGEYTTSEVLIWL